MYTKFIKNKSNKGFTLIEIVVSVMLIAVFLIVFGPPIADMFKEIVNSSENEESFNSAYNLATYYGSSGTDVTATDSANIKCDETFPGDVTINLYKPDGSKVTKDFSIPVVRLYYADYDTGSFGNAKKLCYNDYYVDPIPAP